MALSGSTDWTLSRNSLINMALRKLRAIDPTQAVDDTTIENCSHTLNMMLKAWQADGVDIWLTQEIVVFMNYDSQYYSLGPTGDEAAVITDHVKTQLAAAVAASGTSLTVDSITGIAASDKIGICQDDGTIHWDVVSGSPSGTTVTLTTGMMSAAAIDRWVFAYTSAITRPIKITGAILRGTDDTDTSVEIITDRNEWFAITDKESYGETQKIFYDPLSVNGKLFVWPVCGTTEITDRLILSTTRTIQDMDAASNSFDLPNEALQAVVYGLADELQPEYGMMNNLITAKALGYYERLKKTYKAKPNIYLQPRR